jgi:hypothetical protein
MKNYKILVDKLKKVLAQETKESFEQTILKIRKQSKPKG